MSGNQNTLMTDLSNICTGKEVKRFVTLLINTGRVMNIADDLVRAFNDGYEKGKADAEAYMLHCGDTDEPHTNADRIRAMSDEELAEFIGNFPMETICPNNCHEDPERDCAVCVLDWLKQEVTDGKID